MTQEQVELYAKTKYFLKLAQLFIPAAMQMLFTLLSNVIVLDTIPKACIAMMILAFIPTRVILIITGNPKYRPITEESKQFLGKKTFRRLFIEYNLTCYLIICCMMLSVGCVFVDISQQSTTVIMFTILVVMVFPFPVAIHAFDMMAVTVKPGTNPNEVVYQGRKFFKHTEVIDERWLQQ